VIGSQLFKQFPNSLPSGKWITDNNRNNEEEEDDKEFWV
jgi:hypothetical protein